MHIYCISVIDFESTRGRPYERFFVHDTPYTPAEFEAIVDRAMAAEADDWAIDFPGEQVTVRHTLGGVVIALYETYGFQPLPCHVTVPRVASRVLIEASETLQAEMSAADVIGQILENSVVTDIRVELPGGFGPPDPSQIS